MIRDPSEIRFLEIKYSLAPHGLDVLRSAASRLGAADRAKSIVMCRLLLPSLSEEDAELFLKWLAKQP